MQAGRVLGEQRPHLSVIIFQISIPNRRRTRPHGYVSAKSIQIWAIRPPPPPFSAGTVVGRKRWRWRSAELFVIAGCFSYLKLLDIGHSGSPLDRSRQMTDQGVCAISVASTSYGMATCPVARSSPCPRTVLSYPIRSQFQLFQR